MVMKQSFCNQLPSPNSKAKYNLEQLTKLPKGKHDEFRRIVNTLSPKLIYTFVNQSIVTFVSVTNLYWMLTHK